MRMRLANDGPFNLNDGRRRLHHSSTVCALSRGKWCVVVVWE